MSEMIEVKITDLVGEQLAWAVGKAEGLDVFLAPPEYGNPWRVFARYQADATEHSKRYNPHEDWTLGGPLIHRHGISLHAPQHASDCWAAWAKIDEKEVVMGGGTGIIAACGVVIAGKLGSIVKVPKELMQ